MGKGSCRHVHNAVAELDRDVPEGNNRAGMAVTMNQFDNFQVMKLGPWRFLEVCLTARLVWIEVLSTGDCGLEHLSTCQARLLRSFYTKLPQRNRGLHHHRRESPEVEFFC